jgi:hypothetical protein
MIDPLEEPSGRAALFLFRIREYLSVYSSHLFVQLAFQPLKNRPLFVMFTESAIFSEILFI